MNEHLTKERAVDMPSDCEILDDTDCFTNLDRGLPEEYEGFIREGVLRIPNEALVQ
jgi:hypothetical protein